jgi:hypothetical protein
MPVVSATEPWEQDNARQRRAGLDAARLSAEITAAGHVWADAKAAFDALDRATKPILHSIILRYRAADPKLSRVDAESRAYASAQYADHLRALEAAQRRALISTVDYRGNESYADLVRTEQATRRVELQKLGG